MTKEKPEDPLEILKRIKKNYQEKGEDGRLPKEIADKMVKGTDDAIKKVKKIKKKPQA